MKIINTKYLILYLLFASCITPFVHSMDTGNFLEWVVENDNELDEFTSILDTVNADNFFSETIPPLGNVNPPSLVAIAHNNGHNAPLQPSELNTVVPSSLMAIMHDYPALPTRLNNPDTNKGPKKRKRPNQENELPHDDQIDSPAPKTKKTGAEHYVAVTALTVQSQQDNEPVAMDVEQKQCLVPDCTEMFDNATKHSEHLWTHAVKTISNGSTKYQCPLCKKTAICKALLLRHLRTHTGEKSYKCNHPGCNYAATQKGNLITHKLTHTDKKPYKCNYPECNFATTRQWILKTHKLTHTGVKPYKCNYPECNFAATQKSNLNTHKLTHTGEKLHKCGHPGCDFAGSRKIDLIRHVRTHTGEKPHKCNHPNCNYATSRKIDLKIHKLTHTGEKPHKCDHPNCNYASIRKNDLKKHKLTHTGKKPHKCDHPNCNYASNNRSHLNRHKQTCKFRT